MYFLIWNGNSKKVYSQFCSDVLSTKQDACIYLAQSKLCSTYFHFAWMQISCFFFLSVERNSILFSEISFECIDYEKERLEVYEFRWSLSCFQPFFNLHTPSLVIGQLYPPMTLGTQRSWQQVFIVTFCEFLITDLQNLSSNWVKTTASQPKMKFRSACITEEHFKFWDWGWKSW